MSNNLPRLLTPCETAKVLGLSVATLATWRCVRRFDLPFCRVGRSVRYKEDDVLAFIDRRTTQQNMLTAA